MCSMTFSRTHSSYRGTGTGSRCGAARLMRSHSSLAVHSKVAWPSFGFTGVSHPRSSVQNIREVSAKTCPHLAAHSRHNTTGLTIAVPAVGTRHHLRGRQWPGGGHSPGVAGPARDSQASATGVFVHNRRGDRAHRCTTTLTLHSSRLLPR